MVRRSSFCCQFQGLARVRYLAVAARRAYKLFVKDRTPRLRFCPYFPQAICTFDRSVVFLVGTRLCPCSVLLRIFQQPSLDPKQIKHTQHITHHVTSPSRKVNKEGQHGKSTRKAEREAERTAKREGNMGIPSRRSQKDGQQGNPQRKPQKAIQQGKPPRNAKKEMCLCTCPWLKSVPLQAVLGLSLACSRWHWCSVLRM